MANNKIKPDLQAATDFLTEYFGKEPWHLTAIRQLEPKGIRDGESFPHEADRVEKFHAWIEKHTAEQNDLYFSINRLKPGVMLSRQKMKAKKEDIEAATHLHVDADPRKLAGTVLQEERRIILERLQGIEPRPTWIIASGNGVWGVWNLRRPFPVDGPNGNATLEIEERNAWLAEEVGRDWADDCENVDRIARLPGSINHKAMRRASVLMYFPDRVFDTNEFGRSVKAKKKAVQAVALPDDLPKVDIDKIQIPDKLRKTIKTPDYTKTKGDRSAVVFAVACALARAGLEEAEIASVLLNPDYKISDHVLEQRDPMRTASRVIGEAIAALPQPGDEAPPYSEADLAIRFLYKHAHQLRYVSAWHRWLKWDGARWSHEETDWAVDLMSQICREAAWEMGTQSNANPRPVASAKTVRGAENLARVDRRVAASVEQFDRDPWTLNTPNGVVDLRSGKLKPPDLGDYCTKITSVAPTTNVACNLWLEVLHTAMNGDTTMVAYLKRLFGYSLTGVTIEEVFSFFHGPGQNGKTKITEAVAGAMGDYAIHTPMETFLTSQHGRHPTELADLAGARFVTAVETDEGRVWDAARIKAITGGDTIKARFMRQDFFEFKPQFKVLVHGNARPKFRTRDFAMRRRLHMVPFDVIVPEEKRDRYLADKLRLEWPGILAWMIEGCVEWQRDGLAPPPKVVAASDAYFEEQDTLAHWLEECCVVEKPADYLRTGLFDCWLNWCAHNGERPGTARDFFTKLEAHGFDQIKDHGARKFVGLRVDKDPGPVWLNKAM